MQLGEFTEKTIELPWEPHCAPTRVESTDELLQAQNATDLSINSHLQRKLTKVAELPIAWSVDSTDLQISSTNADSAYNISLHRLAESKNHSFSADKRAHRDIQLLLSQRAIEFQELLPKKGKGWKRCWTRVYLAISKKNPETVRGLHLLLYVWNHLPSPFQCLQISLAEMLWAVGVSIQNRLISPVSSQCALRRAHSDSPQSIRIHRWCRIMPTLTMVEERYGRVLLVYQI